MLLFHVFSGCCDALSASLLCTMSLMTPVHDPVYVFSLSTFPCWLKWVESAGGKDIPCCSFCFFLLLSDFFFLFPLILAIHVSVCFLVVLRSWLPFHPFATHPYDCHDCPVRRYVYAISLFCLDFVSSLPLFCDIRQPVDLLCLMTLCSTVPFALFVVPIPCLI